MAVFEPSHPPFWCQSHSPSVFRYLHDSPPPSPFYDLPIHFMAGPTRTETSNHRANPLTTPGNPPRPPNAWILYRSDKLKDLPPPPPGMPRRPQADISKTISAMWKSESADVRAQYERLSDIKKAEHQAMYPGYRFQPMKKADKDRLKAEKQAERERERGTRKTKGRTRVGTTQDPPPLYTTEARFGPAGPSPPASGASTPPVSLPSTLQQSSATSQPTPATSHPTPPTDRPTPPGDHPSTPLPTSSSPSPYPPPPSTTSIPPLLAPQPGVPQRPPSASDWQQAQHAQYEHDFNSLWIDGSLPDLSEPTASQEYLTIPLSNQSQQPLGWSPDDPAPLTDLPFFQGDPLHAVLSATDDPNVFNLDDFDVNELFDGSREIEVSMGSNMIPSAFVDMNQYNAFASNFFHDLDAQSSASAFAPPDPSAFASTSASASHEQSSASTPFASDLVQRTGELDGLGSYTFDNAFDERNRVVSFESHDFGSVPPHVTLQTPRERATTPPAPPAAPSAYIPPAGASNSSTRRVAADWRHIRPTPEPEVQWLNQGR